MVKGKALGVLLTLVLALLERVKVALRFYGYPSFGLLYLLRNATSSISQRANLLLALKSINFSLLPV